MSLPGEHGPLICQGGHCKVYHSVGARTVRAPWDFCQWATAVVRTFPPEPRGAEQFMAGAAARVFYQTTPPRGRMSAKALWPRYARAGADDRHGVHLGNGIGCANKQCLRSVFALLRFCKEIFFTNYTVVMLTPVCKGVCGDLPAPEQKADLLPPVFPERSAAVSCMQDCSAARWSGLQKERGRCPA